MTCSAYHTAALLAAAPPPLGPPDAFAPAISSPTTDVFLGSLASPHDDDDDGKLFPFQKRRIDLDTPHPSNLSHLESRDTASALEPASSPPGSRPGSEMTGTGRLSPSTPYLNHTQSSFGRDAPVDQVEAVGAFASGARILTESLYDDHDDSPFYSAEYALNHASSARHFSAGGDTSLGNTQTVLGQPMVDDTLAAGPHTFATTLDCVAASRESPLDDARVQAADLEDGVAAVSIVGVQHAALMAAVDRVPAAAQVLANQAYSASNPIPFPIPATYPLGFVPRTPDLSGNVYLSAESPCAPLLPILPPAAAPFATVNVESMPTPPITNIEPSLAADGTGALLAFTYTIAPSSAPKFDGLPNKFGMAGALPHGKRGNLNTILTDTSLKFCATATPPRGSEYKHATDFIIVPPQRVSSTPAQLDVVFSPVKDSQVKLVHALCRGPLIGYPPHLEFDYILVRAEFNSRNHASCQVAIDLTYTCDAVKIDATFNVKLQTSRRGRATTAATTRSTAGKRAAKPKLPTTAELNAMAATMAMEQFTPTHSP
ncbi:hypothetical protein H9P43_002263 [Blastocladiella emersonii ATCC 22665]|nr:hypothetical protein H9P43_002263 [Blastocladiella emersonii ATCC 22665]